ncbi:hypothetical protein HCN44_010415 [Aphidius gifuensis]|uniref:Uncharacterized protein n=1 Tax=Aphidius gifuensis TaxID=684658 RepID=A0A834XI44_APHGI|nr:hypothetical protein HCN44_010415 [Aphidius gifuensis]
MEDTISNDKNNKKNWFLNLFYYFKYITVEPTMWLYMMAFMSTTVIEQSLFIYKACRVDHGLSEEICRNKINDSNLNNKIQITVSNFHQWNDISGHIFPIILALFIGNWSDKHGRKIPLLFGLFGKFLYSMMIVVNLLNPTWNLNMIFWTATIPSAIFGGDVAIFASCFAYITDVTTLKQRTLRVTILDVVYLSTMPIGIYLGSYLYNEIFEKSYIIMFLINTFFLLLSLNYSLIFLKWRTNEFQIPVDTQRFFSDFFNKKHVISIYKTVTIKRIAFGRLHLWFLFLSMCLYMFQRSETQMIFLYTQKTFNWDVVDNSYFRVYKSSLLIIAMSIVARTLDGYIKDSYVVAIGACSHAIGRIFFAAGKNSTIFYLGATFASFGPIVAPTLRSMTSKVVSAGERGKAFAILAVCDNAIPLICSPLYSQIYIKTIDYLPSAFFWLTFVTQVAILIIALIIQYTSLSNKDSSSSSIPENNNEQDVCEFDKEMSFLSPSTSSSTLSLNKKEDVVMVY